MVINKKPDFGNGFIYILGHPSMKNIYKVGLTTNSVKKRIQELTTTGVPKAFKAKKIFEIDANYLQDVEQLAHQKLKAKKMHYGKEFFKGSLGVCQEAVEDAIYEITNSNSQDLIGEAAQRAREKRHQNEQKQKQAEHERRQVEYKYKRLEGFNQKIDNDKRRYKLINSDFLTDGYGLTLLLVYFIGMFVVKEIPGNAISVWMLVGPFVIYFLYRNNEELKLNKLYPYASIENIDKLIEKQAIDKRIEKYERECINGNSYSCNVLGNIYRTAPFSISFISNKEPDYKDDFKAVKYYQEACDLGNGHGCEILGYMYNNGKGVKKDYLKAIEFQKKACNFGNIKACLDLSSMYSTGKDVKVDSSKELEYREKACNFGNIKSCIYLSNIYNTGKGVKVDFYKEFKYQEKACKWGDVNACLSIGDMHEKGRGVKQDNHKAIEYYGKANDLKEKLAKTQKLIDEFIRT